MITYEVESKSQPGVVHTVIDHETFLECDCKAYQYNKHCSHTKKVLKIINEKYAKK